MVGRARPARMHWVSVGWGQVTPLLFEKDLTYASAPRKTDPQYYQSAEIPYGVIRLIRQSGAVFPRRGEIQDTPRPWAQGHNIFFILLN